MRHELPHKERARLLSAETECKSCLTINQMRAQHKLNFRQLCWKLAKLSAVTLSIVKSILFGKSKIVNLVVNLSFTFCPPLQL